MLDTWVGNQLELTRMILSLRSTMKKANRASFTQFKIIQKIFLQLVSLNEYLCAIRARHRSGTTYQVSSERSPYVLGVSLPGV